LSNLNIDSKSELHLIKDGLEAIKDALRDVPTSEDLEGVRSDVTQRTAALTEVETKVREIESRVDFLDKNGTRGQKEYTLFDNPREKALRSFGGVFTVARHASQGRDLPEGFARAQSEGTDTAGGVFVPDEILNDALRIVRERSIARNLLRVIPMASDEMRVPTVVSGPTAEFLGEGAVPGQDADVTFASTANSKMNVETLVLWGVISRELADAALTAMEPVLGEIYAEAIGKKENEAAFVHDSANAGEVFDSADKVVTGGNTVQFAAGKTSFSDITYADLNSVLYKIDSDLLGSPDLAFVCNAQAFQPVTGLLDGNNRPLFATGFDQGISGGAFGGVGFGAPQTLSQARLLGLPVYFTSVMPTDAANKTQFLVGAWQKGLFGDRRQLVIEVDDSVLRKTRQRAILVSERFSVFYPQAAAFAKIKTAAA